MHVVKGNPAIKYLFHHHYIAEADAEHAMRNTNRALLTCTACRLLPQVALPPRFPAPRLQTLDRCAPEPPSLPTKAPAVPPPLSDPLLTSVSHVTNTLYASRNSGTICLGNSGRGFTSLMDAGIVHGKTWLKVCFTCRLQESIYILICVSCFWNNPQIVQ